MLEKASNKFSSSERIRSITIIIPPMDRRVACSSRPLFDKIWQATDIKIASDRIINLRNRLNRILSKNTGKSLKTIEKDTERDNYLSSDEALEYGIVDKIIKK